MSAWWIVLMAVGYLAVGSLSARVTAWLAKERVIFIPERDLRGTLVAVVYLWPVLVSGWLLVQLVRFLAFPSRLR